MARPRLTRAPVSRKLEWECGVWRRWRGRARHRGVRGARLQHQLVTALPEPSNLRPHGSGQCLVEDTGRAGPGCFLRWLAGGGSTSVPSPSGQAAWALPWSLLRVPSMCTHMCQTAAPQPVPLCRGLRIPTSRPTLHSSLHTSYTLQTSSARVLAKTFIDGFLVNYQISSLA